MKSKAQLLTEVWDCDAKLHEWVLRKADNSLIYVPVKSRHAYKDNNMYGNCLVATEEIEVLNLDQVVDMIGAEYPEDPHSFVVFVNNIALHLDKIMV